MTITNDNCGDWWWRGRAPDCQSMGGSIPPAAVSKLTFACFLSEETLKAGSLFYLVSMPGDVKDPTQGVNV